MTQREVAEGEDRSCRCSSVLTSHTPGGPATGFLTFWPFWTTFGHFLVISVISGQFWRPNASFSLATVVSFRESGHFCHFLQFRHFLTFRPESSLLPLLLILALTVLPTPGGTQLSRTVFPPPNRAQEPCLLTVLHITDINDRTVTGWSLTVSSVTPRVSGAGPVLACFRVPWPGSPWCDGRGVPRVRYPGYRPGGTYPACTTLVYRPGCTSLGRGFSPTNLRGKRGLWAEASLLLT